MSTNCTNCGAPLSLVAGQDHFCCDFCGTLQFPASEADSVDRVTPLDEPAGVDCPVCFAELMHAAVDGARVLYCQPCRGVLCECEAFAHVVQRRRAEFDGADATPDPLDRSQFERQLICPKCNRRMETHAYYGPGNAVIDSCSACRLIWVDYGELAAIETAPGRR